MDQPLDRGDADGLSYDFEDFGGAAEVSLPDTDRCADSDPTTKPEPLPSMVAGDWLNSWEMYCEGPGRAAGPFGVRGEFLDGAVEGCEAHQGDIGQGTFDGPNGIAAWNPDGDMRRLGMAWEDTACTSAATVSLYPTVAGYRANAISIGSTCPPAMTQYAVLFYLTSPVDASLVRGEVQRLID